MRCSLVCLVAAELEDARTAHNSLPLCFTFIYTFVRVVVNGGDETVRGTGQRTPTRLSGELTGYQDLAVSLN